MPRYNTVARMDCTDRAADLLYAIIAQAVVDYKDLAARHIVDNGHCALADDNWPQRKGGRGKPTENSSVLGYYRNPQRVEELCEFVAGMGLPRLLDAVASKIDARTVRRKLGVASRGDMK